MLTQRAVNYLLLWTDCLNTVSGSYQTAAEARHYHLEAVLVVVYPNACPMRRWQIAAMKVKSRVMAATALVDVFCNYMQAQT